MTRMKPREQSPQQLQQLQQQSLGKDRPHAADEGLDRHQPAYDKAFPHFEENRVVHEAYGARLATLARTERWRSMLSLGVGHAEVARPLVQLVREEVLERYVIVDAASQMLRKFQQSVHPEPPGLELVEAYFESFEHAVRFDAIEAGFVLEHVDDPAKLLQRMRRFLAPGGRLFVAVPNAMSLHRRIGHEAGLLPDCFALSAADRALGHQRYFDVLSLGRLVQDCGYKVESTEGLLLKPLTSQQLNQLALTPDVWRALQSVAKPYPELSNSFCMELSAAS